MSSFLTCFWNRILVNDQLLFEYSFRLFEHTRESFVKVPWLGAVSYLTLGVSPFCIAFAVAWGVFRRCKYAWIGQDILVRFQLVIRARTHTHNNKIFFS